MILTSKPVALAFTCMRDFSDLWRPAGHFHGRSEVPAISPLLWEQSSTNNWQYWCINTSTPSFPRGTTVRHFLHWFPEISKKHYTHGGSCLDTTSLPCLTPIPFSVFPGTIVAMNNLYSNLYLKFCSGRTLHKTGSVHTLKRRKFSRTQLSSGL